MDIEINHYIKEVEESSKRARQVFLILVFATLSIFIAFINALPPSLNWFESRAENFRRADQIFYFVGDVIEENDKNLMSNNSIAEIKTLKQFIVLNESNFPKDSLELKIWLNKNHEHLNKEALKLKHPLTVAKYEPHVLNTDLKKRIETYDLFLISLKNILKYSLIQRSTYNGKIQAINTEEFDKIMFVHVPILGLSFDINNLGLFSGLLMSILYWLLYAALQREHVNTKIAFRKGWEEVIEGQKQAKSLQHKTLLTGILESKTNEERVLHPFNFYEYISMKQVLNMPKKLFAPPKRKSFNSIGKFVLYFPVFVFGLVVFNDGIPTFATGVLTNSKLTIISITIEILLLVICVVALVAVLGQWRKMNNLWNFQAVSYNFEFILECIGEDNPCDLMEFAENILLTKSNRDDVKMTWYYYWKTYQNSSNKSIGKCSKTFLNFVDDCLEPTFRSISVANIDNKELEAVWEALKAWHKEDGSLNIKENFQESLQKKVFNYGKN